MAGIFRNIRSWRIEFGTQGLEYRVEDDFHTGDVYTSMRQKINEDNMDIAAEGRKNVAEIVGLYTDIQPIHHPELLVINFKKHEKIFPLPYPTRIIDTEASLAVIVDRMNKHPFVYCTTAVETIYSYRGMASAFVVFCGYQIYIFDLILLRDRSQILDEFLKNPKVIKVMWECEPQIQLLYKDLGLSVVNILDLQKVGQFVEHNFDFECYTSYHEVVERTLQLSVPRRCDFSFHTRPFNVIFNKWAFDQVRYLPILAYKFLNKKNGFNAMRIALDESPNFSVLSFHKPHNHTLGCTEYSSTFELLQYTREMVAKVEDFAPNVLMPNATLLVMNRYLNSWGNFHACFADVHPRVQKYLTLFEACVSCHKDVVIPRVSNILYLTPETCTANVRHNVIDFWLELHGVIAR